jgi:plasmid stabilization system protein ParE
VNVSFHLLAERELNDAAQYYELKSPGLGAAFLAEVESCCDAILSHPEAGPRVLGSVRRGWFDVFLMLSFTHFVVRMW